jgi:hypothetical protein
MKENSSGIAELCACFFAFFAWEQWAIDKKMWQNGLEKALHDSEEISLEATDKDCSAKQHCSCY